MSDGTKIQWSDASWTPIRARRKDGQPNKGGGGWACQRVSAGCQNCYAATINKRLGTGFDYDAKGIAASDIYLDEKALTQPLHWRRPRKVFVCSMTDLFGDWVSDEMIDRVFAVMALTPQHTYQVLTKRAERMREYVQRHSAYPLAGTLNDLFSFGHILGLDGVPRNAVDAWTGWPLPNVWLGVSAENQRWADKRIPVLLDTPAAVRFVSAEPLLGQIHLMHYWLPNPHLGGPVLSWVIVGGESGPGARPCDLEWIRGIVRQCQAAGVAVFVKQLGAKPREHFLDRGEWPVDLEWRGSRNVPPVSSPEREPDWWAPVLSDRKGGDPAEWPEDLRVREMPR